jgi:menaquinone-9 beta-reductase
VSTKPDIFVIGGGPVGLAAAIAARREGFHVVLADAREPPIDKACGEGVLPDGVAAAAMLGIDLRAIESQPIRGIRFCGEGVAVAAEFANEPGRGIRRTALHAAMVQMAERCGVELRWGCSIAALSGIQAKWIVGADGIGSLVRKWAGLDSFARDSRRYGFRIHFRTRPWTDHVEIHWADGCQIYITPVASDEVSVALLCRDAKMRVGEMLQAFPAISARLRAVPHTSRERGALTASRRLRRVSRENIALIGDASGSVDAISGEGLCLGFRQAIALTKAIKQNDLNVYESAHRALLRRPQFMADFILTMDHSPRLRRRALPALAADPELFEGLVAMHVGTARKKDFAAHCLTLGWKMLSNLWQKSTTTAC